ncbi:lytic transglycosylase domain-containing protein [Sutterella sp.]|uniref:lytic transglycosylase domain-containing protein n=1 Tax=Sutterella sp. TaxID=1981025 RepID=UPI003FD8FBC8
MAYDIDPALLYSISIVESAVDDPTRSGYLKPSPWTLRTSTPFYAASRREAEVELLRLLRLGRSVDVGMMQVNTRWHGHRVKDPLDLLDPLVNVRVAAEILSEQMRRYPKDAALAVGHYHSADSKRARWYARHVMRIYTNIKTQE